MRSKSGKKSTLHCLTQSAKYLKDIKKIIQLWYEVSVIDILALTVSGSDLKAFRKLMSAQIKMMCI